MSETRTALHRIKRRLGKERARCDRIYKEATSAFSRERAYGESNMLTLAMAFIDAEVRKVPK